MLLFFLLLLQCYVVILMLFDVFLFGSEIMICAAGYYSQEM